MKFVIEKEIFEHFPGMKILAAVAEDIPTADVEKIREKLNHAWTVAAAAAVEYGNAQSHPFIKPWGERMKALGVSRKQFPCSIEAMVRRAGKSDTPFTISPLVDFYNAISLEYLVPAGAFDMDDLDGDLELRFSREGDTFTSLDNDEEISIPAGEVGYADGNQIVTRHFVYKQAKHGILTDNSRRVLFVSEILGDLPVGTTETVAQALQDGLKECFGVETTVAILDENNRSFG